MTSAAQDESYGNPRWRHRPRGGPWGFWGGGGCGWQQANWRGRDGEGSWSAQSWGPAWGGHPFWGPHFIPKPVLIVATILGFMLWWPVGLVLLMVTLCRRHVFYGYPRWRGWQSAAAAPGTSWKGWFGGEPSSSGNRAFDEYRAETLRRLEEEQKEFAEFLERLRFAKDKSEFDEFMNGRRNRPSGTPPEPPQPAN
jgi:hypothetical protein